MKLGEMLVRDGRMTQEALDAAIDRQARDGGRLGTVLTEMGLVDLDTLTIYLGLELGIPIASGATLERVKKTAVKLLAPRDAARFRCVPIVIQHRQLIAAIDDPHDLQALGELSQITSYRVVPRVAPEIRIYYYLERYYGIRRPERFAALGNTPRGSRKRPADPGLPAPPLPGLPPEAETLTPAPTPAPVLRTSKRAPTEPPPPPALREVEIEAEDLVEVLEADEAAPAETAEIKPAQPAKPVAAPEPPAAQTPAFEPEDADTAIAAMEEAGDRATIAHHLMRFATSVFDTGVLMVVRDNMAFGWQMFGADIDQARIEALLIPLETPSIFQMALHSGGLHHGHAFPSTLHDYLFKVLRTPRPPFSLASTVAIAGRNVNLLYGHVDAPVELAEETQADIRRVCAAAAAAYLRLIEASKGRARTQRETDELEDGEGAGAKAAAENSKAEDRNQPKKKKKRRKRKNKSKTGA